MSFPHGEGAQCTAGEQTGLVTARETILDLSDARARLTWAEGLGRRVVAQVRTARDETAARGLIPEERVIGEHRYVRWCRSTDFPVPEEVGFLFADFVMNVRSALDIAMTSVAETLGLDWKRPDFPLLDSKDDRTAKTLQKRLPEPYLEAVLDIQPQPFPVGGDFPMNLTAIELRQLANINKHRRLTPVVHRESNSGGFTHGGPDADLIQLTSEVVPGWPREPCVMLVQRAPASVPLSSFEATQPFVSMSVVVDAGEGGGYDPGDGFVLPVNVLDFIPRAEAYARLALKRLEQADYYRRHPPTGRLLFDFNAGL